MTKTYIRMKIKVFFERFLRKDDEKNFDRSTISIWNLEVTEHFFLLSSSSFVTNGRGKPWLLQQQQC